MMTKSPSAGQDPLMLDALPLPTWIMSGEGLLEHANQACHDLLANGHLEILSGDDWLRWIHPADRVQAELLWRQAVASHTPFKHTLRVQAGANPGRWMQVHLCPQDTSCADTLSWLGTLVDVDEFMQTTQALSRNVELRDDMLDASVDCIKIIDLQGALIHMNKAGCEALGVPVDETKFGMKWLSLLPPEVRRRGKRALKLACSGEIGRFPGMSIIDGEKPKYWDNVLTPLKDNQGKTTSILCVSRNVTAQREAEKRLRVASELDALTGVFNRRAFKTRLWRMLGRARQGGTQLGLVLIDFDHFKNVNDMFGHPAGDNLLRVLSRRIQAHLPKSAVIYRLGGDEFAIVVDRLIDEQQLIAMARQALAQRDEPISYAGRLIVSGLSIGCAMFPRDAENASDLMACADAALKDLKASGRGGIRMFSTHTLESTQQAARQLYRARQAVDQDAIEPFYQPKVRLIDGSIIGFEALLRCRHPQRGVELPGVLTAAFGDYELATLIGMRMQDKVLADMTAWRNSGLTLLPISINVSPLEFLREDFAESLLGKLRDLHIPPELIEIEITEYAFLKRGMDRSYRTIQALKAGGLRFSLDDFGTGHSSFTYLRDFPINGLKIDGDFVGRMTNDPSIWSIVQALVNLGQPLSIDVIAEGIETERQREMLLAAGCSLGQGFLFSPAVHAETTRRLLEHRPTLPFSTVEIVPTHTPRSKHRSGASPDTPAELAKVG